jgi:hypothetical protein
MTDKASLLKARLLTHGLVAFVAWPLFTVIAAAVEAGAMPYYHLAFYRALGISAASVYLLGPDFLLAALCLSCVSVAIFSIFGHVRADRRRHVRLFVEAALTFLAIFCGTALWYPTVLSHALLVLLWALPTWIVLLLLVACAANLVCQVAAPGSRVRLAVVLGVLGITAPMPALIVGSVWGGHARPADVVVLGLDSISQSDDVDLLREWAGRHHGAWYDHAVSPGLLTNAVWSSVLTMQPVRDHGVFHVFQRLAPGRTPLLKAAAQAGFYSISFFPDQTTCVVGSQGGFDEDRSGPLGWRQLALATVENSSVLLPLIRPVMPRLPWSVAPPNHAGTFTYDLRRDVRDILLSGRARDQRVFAVGHLTYLHTASYPRATDLSWNDLLAVAGSPAGALRDRSFDWDDVDLPTDALTLHRWKLAHLQSVVASTVDQTHFLDRGGKLLVFSDHGERSGLTLQTFAERRYHNVVLVTFGLPETDIEQPKSLIDIAALIGFVVPAAPADPVVEFAVAPSEMWSKLAETSRVNWSGLVDLDSDMLRNIFHNLRAHRPWGSAMHRELAVSPARTSPSGRPMIAPAPIAVHR